MAPEEITDGPGILDGILDAMRFQFPELNSQSTYQDELCLELLEQCLSEARAAGIYALKSRSLVH